MNLARAMKAIEEIVTDELQRLAFDANLHDLAHQHTWKTISAARKRKQIIDAWYAIKQELSKHDPQRRS